MNTIKSKAKSGINTVKNKIKDPGMCPDLSRTTRIIGFIVTVFAGFFLIISNIFKIFDILLFDGKSFAIWYTLGNIVALSSTFFYNGPKQQWSKMMEPVRMLSSLLLILSMILTVVVAIFFTSKMLLIIIVSVQLGCLIWYILSYTPKGQETFASCLKEKINEGTQKAKNAFVNVGTKQVKDIITNAISNRQNPHTEKFIEQEGTELV